MANMEASDRAQYERADLRAGGEGIRRGSERGAGIYTAIALLIAAALSYAAVEAIDGWAQWLVLVVIFLTAVGVSIAVNPFRRQAG
jgi:hypothetical protein